MVNKVDILKLYKQLLNTSRKFDNYNFREYSKRKVINTFKDNKALEGDVTGFYNQGIDELAKLTRQTTISQLYTFDKLVIEPLKQHH